MTAERDETLNRSQPPVAAEADRVSVGRRALIRGASVAAPAILTLNSNSAAAWAIASGTIGTTAPTGGGGDALCLDTTNLYSPKPGVYEIGSPPYPAVVDIPSSLEYQVSSDNVNWTAATPEQVCLSGPHQYVQWRYRNTTDWYSIRTQPYRGGALVSSTAVASFGGGIGPSITDI